METILIWLAQGAVSYLGGTALSSILGNDKMKGAQNLVEAAVRRLEFFIKHAIDDNEVRALNASMQSVLRNLNDYARLKTAGDRRANSFLLTDAILVTSDTVSQCASLGVPALLCYANAVSLNLLSRSAYYRLGLR